MTTNVAYALLLYLLGSRFGQGKFLCLSCFKTKWKSKQTLLYQNRPHSQQRRLLLRRDQTGRKIAMVLDALIYEFSAPAQAMGSPDSPWVVGAACLRSKFYAVAISGHHVIFDFVDSVSMFHHQTSLGPLYPTGKRESTLNVLP